MPVRRTLKEKTLSEQPTASPIGAILADRFRVDRLIGNGGMAAVYEATDVVLGRNVAIKLFRNDTLDDAQPERQSGEVALLASLNHFALVTLYDAGTATIDGASRTFIVMEFIDGQDLRSQIAGGPVSPTDAAEMGADLAEALHYVHSQGIIHRDIKPANVLLAPSSFPGRSSHAKLADFGIARLLDEARLTATGTLIGTASYLSPEQALGEPIGPPSDVYSLGLVLLECLTGERAYPGTAIESAMARLQRQPQIPASLGREWSSLLEAMTSRHAPDRPGASDVATALRALRSDGAESSTQTQLLAADAGDATALLDTPDRPDTAATKLMPTASGAGTSPMTAPPHAANTNVETVVLSAVDSQQGLDDTDTAATSRPRRESSARQKKWLPIALVAVAGILITILAVVLLQRPTGPAATPPSYPAVEGTLGTHLEELQKSVEP
ncbi:MAG: serine/threonine-protein kinase [Cryobacterium sp.]